jgi:MFS-type transporter involved in bile tolerance (Atg22 family)
MFATISPQTTTNDHSPRALLVVFGAFTSLFCTVGFLNSSGVFIEYYAHEQLSTSSSSTIAWLGAISIFFLYALSPAIGALLDAFGPKVRCIHPRNYNGGY